MLTSRTAEIKATVNHIKNDTCAESVPLIKYLLQLIGVDKVISSFNGTRMPLYRILIMFIGMSGYGLEHISQLFRDQKLRGKVEFCQATLYNALKHYGIDWMGLTFYISERVAKWLLGKCRQVYFVVDDTLVVRDSSKFVDLICRVFDHNEKKYHKGFTILTLGVTAPGKPFIPLYFRVLSSSNESNVLYDRDKHHSAKHGQSSRNKAKAHKRRNSAAMARVKARGHKMDALIEMLENAIAADIGADTVLMDSWFSAPKNVKRITDLKLHVITMLKVGSAKYTTYDGKTVTTKGILDEIKASKTNKSIARELYVQLDGGLQGKLIFAKNWSKDGSAKRRPYIPLLTTHTSWSGPEICDGYELRWNIEVFYNQLKNGFYLQSGNQTRLFESNLALICLTHIRYTIAVLAQDHMSPAEEQLSLSEVCHLLNLETTYDDAIEAVRHRIKNAYSAVDKAVSEIGDELRSKLDPQTATAWQRKILEILHRNLDQEFVSSLKAEPWYIRVMLNNKVKSGNIVVSNQFLKSTNGVNKPMFERFEAYI